MGEPSLPSVETSNKRFFSHRNLVFFSLAIVLIPLSTIFFILTSLAAHPEPLPEQSHTAVVSNSTIAPPSETLPAESEAQPPLNPQVTLTAGGDVMFDTFIYNWISAYGINYPWEDVACFFQEADIAIVNFESSSSLRGASTKPEGYGFRSPPHTLQNLIYAGIDYVSLGNNHVLDYGREAFADTLGNLTALDIAYSGAGMDQDQAEAVAIIERQGLSIGFLSYTAIIPHDGWRADEDRPGIAPLFNENDILRTLDNVTRSKELCDVLIVMPHWGIEYADRPTEWQRSLAHRLIDAGADMIIGGHPHVLQGVEFYQQKPIFYSLGNFIFLKMDDDAGKTAVFNFTLDQEGFVSCSLHPVFIDSCKANLLPEDHWMYQEILQRFSRLSAELGTTVDEQGVVSKHK